MHPTGNQIISGALGRGPGKHRGFHLNKIPIIQVTTQCTNHLMPQTQVTLHPVTAKVQISIPQAQRLARVRILNGERQGISTVEYRDLETEQLDLTRGQVGVYRAFRAQPDTADDLKDIFTAYGFGDSKLLFPIRIKDHLH